MPVEDFPARSPGFGDFSAPERHLHTFSIMPLHKDRQGGNVVKVTAYFDTGVQHRMHLTDQRIVLEPLRPGAAERWAERAILVGAGLLFGAPTAAPLIHQTEKARAESDRHLRTYGQDVLAIPLNRIAGLETFRQGFARICRVDITGLPKDTLVFWLSGGVAAMSAKRLETCVALIDEARTRR
ncbi:hypothetical protein AB0O34_26175 [Sphaerisporangium sp. NPDC088356]|uniref:hypothetical protein n=1 Tax=Sphaerisporangium sp. NPDC088356 TaxID=3154871 RepID=UPI003441E67A